MTTRFNNLSHDEFLNLLEHKDRSGSELMSELISRYKALIGLGVSVVKSTANHRAECPVCEADLSVDYDDENDLFEVKVHKC